MNKAQIQGEMGLGWADGADVEETAWEFPLKGSRYREGGDRHFSSPAQTYLPLFSM